jgi:hypothetical protein
MCPEAIDFENEVELLTSSYDWEAEESLRGVWMRACPHCNAVLCKTSLGDAVRCACGWEWQA